jgi:hypothetical protein
VLFPQLLPPISPGVNFTSDKISAATATFISLSAAFFNSQHSHKFDRVFLDIEVLLENSFEKSNSVFQ